MTLLDRAIDRFGGDALWQRIDCVMLRFRELGGALPRAKGMGKTFKKPDLVRVYPRAFRAEYEGLGIFEAGIVDGRNDRRRTFDGFRKYRRWSNADAVYFFGYAITTYLSVPFVLRQLETWTAETRNGFEITAVFPPHIHTHGPRQKFYFDRSGLLLRHDYHAEIVGAWARGAHFTSDYETIKGLPVATRRHVYARIGRRAMPIPLLFARIEPVDVSLEEGPTASPAAPAPTP
jgi:hypothetical protein